MPTNYNRSQEEISDKAFEAACVILEEYSDATTFELRPSPLYNLGEVAQALTSLGCVVERLAQPSRLQVQVPPRPTTD